MKDEILVLGEKYQIGYDEDLESLDLLGACDWTTKIIRLSDSLKLPPTSAEVQNVEELHNKILRHEIIHAMMFESGCAECSCIHDEPTVDWIARMYPKMKRLFEELNI